MRLCAVIVPGGASAVKLRSVGKTGLNGNVPPEAVSSTARIWRGRPAPRVWCAHVAEPHRRLGWVLEVIPELRRPGQAFRPQTAHRCDPNRLRDLTHEA